MKKLFVLFCLAIFVASFAACGGSGGEGIRAGDKKPDAKPLSERAEENAQTEVFQ